MKTLLLSHEKTVWNEVRTNNIGRDDATHTRYVYYCCTMYVLLLHFCCTGWTGSRVCPWARFFSAVFGTYVSAYTYLGSRADMRYVRIWYIIPHTKTKRSRTHVHACTRADFFFGMYQLETRFARIIRIVVLFMTHTVRLFVYLYTISTKCLVSCSYKYNTGKYKHVLSWVSW